uniref:Cadherin domain-containing protein n=1 Tax=Macrostomum lignano TaxID=282301 RepID=A0A1I8F309_9PLAT
RQSDRSGFFLARDRRYATLVVRPSLPAIANSHFVPQRGDLQLPTCDSSGYCEFGMIHQSSEYGPDIVRLTLSLCNQLGWCRSPAPSGSWALHLSPSSSTSAGRHQAHRCLANQEYSYQVLLSDGRSLATNSTAVSVAVSPDTKYSALQERPNPALQVVANLGTNQSETLAVSDKIPHTASYLSIVLNSSMLSLEFESTLAIFASTSYGENSSLPNRLIHLPPVCTACLLSLFRLGLPYDTAQSLLHQEDPSSAGSIEAPEGYVSR